MPNIDSQHVLYNKSYKPNNEAWTPRYAVTPLVEFVCAWGNRTRHNPIIWCPFDNGDSEFVKVFNEAGFHVVRSHVDCGQDFFGYEPDKWDIMISNPPYQGKRQIVERALSLNKPFALLLPLTWLNDSAPKQLFMDKDLQLLMFDKRIKFGNQEQKGITFSSAYYCYDLLPKQIIMKSLVVPRQTHKAPRRE